MIPIFWGLLGLGPLHWLDNPEIKRRQAKVSISSVGTVDILIRCHDATDELYIVEQSGFIALSFFSSDAIASPAFFNYIAEIPLSHCDHD
jgi:hypothetical protein